MSAWVGVNCNCDAWQLKSLIHLQHVKDLIASLLFLTWIRSIGYGSYLDPTRWHHSVPRKAGGVSLVRIAPWHDGWTRTLAPTTSQTTASDRWRTLAPPSPPSKLTAPRSPRLPHAPSFSSSPSHDPPRIASTSSFLSLSSDRETRDPNRSTNTLDPPVPASRCLPTRLIGPPPDLSFSVELDPA